MTTAELRASYHGAAGRPTRLKCRNARSFGRSHQRDLTRVGNLCTWSSNADNHPLAPYNRHKHRLKLVQMLIQKGIFPNNNPTSRDITAARLRRMFRVIDKEFYGGSIRRLLLQSTAARPPLTFSIGDEDADVPGGQAVAFLYGGVGGAPRYGEIRIFTGRFRGGRGRRRRTDGVGVTSKLEGLIVVMCHEVTHVLVHVVCQNDSMHLGSHHAVFRNLNHRLWGHSRSIYIYENSPPVIHVA